VAGNGVTPITFDAVAFVAAAVLAGVDPDAEGAEAEFTAFFAAALAVVSPVALGPVPALYEPSESCPTSAFPDEFAPLRPDVPSILVPAAATAVLADFATAPGVLDAAEPAGLFVDCAFEAAAEPSPDSSAADSLASAVAAAASPSWEVVRACGDVASATTVTSALACWSAAVAAFWSLADAAVFLATSPGVSVDAGAAPDVLAAAAFAADAVWLVLAAACTTASCAEAVCADGEPVGFLAASLFFDLALGFAESAGCAPWDDEAELDAAVAEFAAFELDVVALVVADESGAFSPPPLPCHA